MPDDLISKKTDFERIRVVAQGSEWVFTASIIIFVAALSVWGGLFFYQRTLENNAGVWREQIVLLERELSPELLNQLIALSGRLSGAREVLANHNFSSNTFALLEKNTHPRVFFSTFQYSAPSRTITLLAKAASYSAVAEQISILEADSQVESVGFGGLTLDETGLVNFKLTIVFKPSLLKLRPRL